MSGFPSPALPQQPGRVYRFGIFGIGDREGVRRILPPFLGLLARAGFVEGRNLEVVLRVAPSESEPLEPAASQLALDKPDVARILNGADPAGIAFEQATRVVLAVNLKTAKRIGIAIPQSVLIRADRAIQ